MKNLPSRNGGIVEQSNGAWSLPEWSPIARIHKYQTRLEWLAAVHTLAYSFVVIINTKKVLQYRLRIQSHQFSRTFWSRLDHYNYCQYFFKQPKMVLPANKVGQIYSRKFCNGLIQANTKEGGVFPKSLQNKQIFWQHIYFKKIGTHPQISKSILLMFFVCSLLALPLPKPLTVLTRQTRQVVRVINQSIFLRCLWIHHEELF